MPGPAGDFLSCHLETHAQVASLAISLTASVIILVLEIPGWPLRVRSTHSKPLLVREIRMLVGRGCGGGNRFSWVVSTRLVIFRTVVYRCHIHIGEASEIPQPQNSQGPDAADVFHAPVYRLSVRPLIAYCHRRHGLGLGGARRVTPDTLEHDGGEQGGKGGGWAGRWPLEVVGRGGILCTEAEKEAGIPGSGLGPPPLPFTQCVETRPRAVAPGRV